MMMLFLCPIGVRNAHDAATATPINSESGLTSNRWAVKSNGRRVSTLECGHKHTVPPGHELGRKKHRCKPCALGEPV